MLFPQFKANVRVKLAKTGHGPHSSTLVCICVVRLLFVLFYVLFVCKCVVPPGDNPIAVYIYIYIYIYIHTHNIKCTSSWFTLDKFVSDDKRLLVESWQVLLLTVRDNFNLYISFLYSPLLMFSCLSYSSVSI